MSTFKELSGGQYENSSRNSPRAAPQDLDYVIETLRNPSPDVSVLKILGYLYHYVPFVKQEHNLRIVFLSFLNNNVCFSAPVPSFEENYLIIEVFKLICDKKLKVSQPALSIKSFYTILLTEIKNFILFNPYQNCWKALPILTGIALSSDLRDELYLRTEPLQYRWFFLDSDSKINAMFKDCLTFTLSGSISPDITNLALLCLALKFRPESDKLVEYTRRIKPNGLIQQLMTLLFSSNMSGLTVYNKFSEIDPHSPNAEEFINSQVFNKPTMKHLNKLATLVGAFIKILPYDYSLTKLISDMTLLMLDFNQKLNHFSSSSSYLNSSIDIKHNGEAYFSQYWLHMKSILFSEVIIFRDILDRFISWGRSTLMGKITGWRIDSKQLDCHYSNVCEKIIHSLYYLHYILTAIGQGGFDIYNFVYYVSLEFRLRNNRQSEFENFSKFLIGNYQEVNLHYDALNRNYVSRCKVKFVFGLWEYYIQECSQKNPQFMEFIYQTVLELVRNRSLNDTSLVEAGHSDLLAYFAQMDNSNSSIQSVLNYAELLIDHFPKLLSASQLSIAIETLGKKALSNPIIFTDHLQPNSAEMFLDFIYFKCANVSSGVPIISSPGVLFKSGQPVAEIRAESTISQLEAADSEHTNIFVENKHLKPKDETIIPLPSALSPNTQGTEHFLERAAPNTIKEALVVAFFNTIPYFPLSLFKHWLNKIMALIQSSNDEERKFLLGRLWKVLSENLDVNRCEIAYNWWFCERPPASTGPNHLPKLQKL